ncbi:hypothetical protein J4E90_003080 [Alternaria incomplexa]|uniref:uncharacterized protein n=1 Tax=Alternaria incomplexa TaxID=1187928 RepID=UPI002220CAA8|nr:uncharacterized protein J4E90_003080 [Alternaria incomplexa]KAI4918693.1 hypothetical protein J4E90_003080 [Alternaria incomplexa]
MRPSVGFVGLLLVVAPTVLAQIENAPELNTVAPGGDAATNTAETSAAETTQTATTNADETAATSQAATTETTEAATTADAPTSAAAQTGSTSVFNLVGAPTLAGVGIPDIKVPDTAGAAFMQKSDLPDGTVFICVGAILAFFGAAVLAWRGLVAWSLHRSVKRAAMAQNLADIKAMSAVPGKKRGMYNVVGASSTMSLDHLNAAPIGKSNKAFKGAAANTAQQSQSSLFFSPTAGGAAGMRDSVHVAGNRSSTYLPAGYYASGNAAPAAGSPQMHIGSQNPNNLSALSLSTPGNRFSARSGMSPPESPSLPPSRGGYARAPPSRDGLSNYNRNSVATLGHQPGTTRSPVYGQDNNTVSQLSLNVPGGTTVPGGRTPSGYLDDLFENHGNGSRERF